MEDKQKNIMDFNDEEAITLTSQNIVWWKGEKQNDKIVGYYTGINKGENGDSYLLTVDGVQYGLPTHKLLNQAMAEVPLHSVVKIVYEGEQETKDRKRKYALYTVKAIPPPEKHV